MKKLFAIILTLFATSAFAIGIGNDNPPGGGGTQIQGQAQGQIQGQAQGQITNVEVSNRISNDTRANAVAFAGGGSAKSNANSGGNVQNVTVTDSGQTQYSGKYEVKNVPSVFTGNVYPTAPCMGSSTVGGAGVGFGFSVGTSWTDDECGIRETSRSFSGLGLKEDAVKVLCTSKYAAAAPACAAATKEESK